MKRGMRALCLLLGCLLLCGCTASPPPSLVLEEPTDKTLLVSTGAEALPADQMKAVLYFRYGDTDCLAGEERVLEIRKDETPEMALVQALTAGPGATRSTLSPLFPEGTEALAVSRQGDTLFVTFNEALLSRYADEPGDLSREPWKSESTLRRRLCMDALIDTLTEAGLCARVQVLVHREKVQGNSLRLTMGYYSLSQDDTIAPPLTRREDVLLTPHNTADRLLGAWMARDFAALYGFLGGADKPTEQAALSELSGARVLTSYELSPGNVSPDGMSAVLTADLTFQGAGEDTAVSGYPMYLQKENGLWKITYERLAAAMEQD